MSLMNRNRMAPHQAHSLLTTPVKKTGLRIVIFGGALILSRSSNWSARTIYSGWTKSESADVRIASTLFRIVTPGPHVFLVFISLSKCTKVEKRSGQRIEEAFGPKAGRHSMVVFTHEDDLKADTIEDVLAKDPSLQDLVARCGHYHVFNTLRGDKALADELLPKIQDIVQKNGGGCYTNEMYEEWKNQPREKKVREEAIMRRNAYLRMHLIREYIEEREKEAQRKEEEKKREEEKRWLMEEVKSLKEAMKEIIKKARIKEAPSKGEEEGEKQKNEKQREEKRRKKMEEWRRKKDFMEELIKIEQERIKNAQRREEEERKKIFGKIEKTLMEDELREEREKLEKLVKKKRCSIL